MPIKKPLSPFPVTGYYGPKYFCDRDQETQLLLSSLKGGINTTLFAIRRIGKTGLIYHTFHHLQQEKNWLTIYLDILGTTNLQEFVNTFAGAVLNACPETTSTGKKLIGFIKSLRPVITYDPLSGDPQVSIQSGSIADKKATLSGLFKILNSQKQRIAIAIDEFQQVTKYPETNIEALLRSEIQQSTNISFIFSGSQQHLLTSIFADTQRPFFASTQMMKLDKIDNKVYKKFIKRKFRYAKCNIDDDVIQVVLDWTKSHTFYTQYVCNRLFLLQRKNLDMETLFNELDKILKENEVVYFNYRDLLTTPQWRLLTATGKENKLYEPTAKDFIAKHQLGSPATVKRSLETLLQKEMIYRETSDNGKGYYQVYNVFLSRWLENF